MPTIDWPRSKDGELEVLLSFSNLMKVQKSFTFYRVGVNETD